MKSSVRIPLARLMDKIGAAVAGLLCATLLSTLQPAALAAQPPIDRSELVAAVNRTIAMRLDWLRDTIPIDGCSIVAATGDPNFIPRIASRVIQQVDTTGLKHCQQPRKHMGPYVEILAINVLMKDSTRYIEVRQMVRNAPSGSSLQTFYLHPTLSFIDIGEPSITTDKGNGPGRPPRTDTTRRPAVALRVAAGNRPVRWISPRVLCVIPFASPDVTGCEALQTRKLPDALYRELRAAVAADTTDSHFVSCAIVSNEIPFADSTLVVVYLTGPTVEDKFAGVRGTWVWFRRVANRDSPAVRLRQHSSHRCCNATAHNAGVRKRIVPTIDVSPMYRPNPTRPHATSDDGVRAHCADHTGHCSHGMR